MEKKKREKTNVYTDPLTNPQRNPNVDSKRTEPLTAAEIKAIEEVHQQYPELGAWNLSLLLSNELAVHVSTMGILRVLHPEQYKSKKMMRKCGFMKNPDPFVMYHADTMEVTLENKSLIYQISVEDDYSTAKRFDVWHNDVFIKRWKYWKYILGIAAGYMRKRYLL